MARNTINIFAEWVNVEVASDSRRVCVASNSRTCPFGFLRSVPVEQLARQVSPRVEDKSKRFAPELVAEASTPEELEEKLKTLIPELLELNAQHLDDA